MEACSNELEDEKCDRTVQEDIDSDTNCPTLDENLEHVLY